VLNLPHIKDLAWL